MRDDTPIVRENLVRVLGCVALVLFVLNFIAFLQRDVLPNRPFACWLEAERCCAYEHVEQRLRPPAELRPPIVPPGHERLRTELERMRQDMERRRRELNVHSELLERHAERLRLHAERTYGASEVRIFR